MKIFAILPFVFAVPGLSFAGQNCENSLGIQTPAGKLVSTDCYDSGGQHVRKSISIEGRKLLDDRWLYGDLAVDRTRIHWIYQSEPQMKTGCSEKFYLIDLSYNPPKVFSFGVKNACNEYEWSSWSNKRSVISLKHNVKFVYQNGKIIPPAKGERLWESIEPPHAGSGMAVDDLVPFGEELPLPQP